MMRGGSGSCSLVAAGAEAIVPRTLSPAWKPRLPLHLAVHVSRALWSPCQRFSRPPSVFSGSWFSQAAFPCVGLKGSGRAAVPIHAGTPAGETGPHDHHQRVRFTAWAASRDAWSAWPHRRAVAESATAAVGNQAPSGAKLPADGKRHCRPGNPPGPGSCGSRFRETHGASFPPATSAFKGLTACCRIRERPLSGCPGGKLPA